MANLYVVLYSAFLCINCNNAQFGPFPRFVRIEFSTQFKKHRQDKVNISTKNNFRMAAVHILTRSISRI